MRCAVAFLSAALLVALLPLHARAQDKEKIEVKMDEATKKACAEALVWLAGKQNKDDGSWSDGRYAHNTAITSFALLAFLSQGHLPNQGHFGTEVARAMR